MGALRELSLTLTISAVLTALSGHHAADRA